MIRVILLRGVNVGGSGRLPMEAFRAMLREAGFGAVRSYIQSGNAVVDSDLDAAEVARIVRDGIAARFGFAPEVIVRDAEEMRAALTDHPFGAADPARVIVLFLTRPVAEVDEGLLRGRAAPGEAWQLAPGRFTFHAPQGVGRSALAGRLEQALGVPFTGRNLRTVAALLAMTQA